VKSTQNTTLNLVKFKKLMGKNNQGGEEFQGQQIMPCILIRGILRGHFVRKICKICENRSHNYLQSADNLERCAVFCFARQDLPTKPSDPTCSSSLIKRSVTKFRGVQP
jgi:hypothetical protein